MVEVTRKHRILVYDIETAPGLAYVWRAKTTWIPDSMMKQSPFMLMWAAQWLDGTPIMWDAVTPEEVANQDDSRVVASIAKLMREADIVLAHNGDSFDIPWVRGRLWLNDLEPLGPIASIDTRKISARDFSFMHNNLNSLIKAKLDREKIRTDFSWWRDIMENTGASCQKAINRMLKYCKKDTKDLADLFKSMQAHAHRLPRLITSQGEVCPNCGSGDLTSRGFRQTKAFEYQKFQCNSCKRYCSFRTHNEKNTNPNRVI